MAKISNEREYLIFWVVVVLALLLLPVIVFMVFRDFLIFKLLAATMENFWWLILPVPLWFLFRAVWGEYTDFKFVTKQEYDLLEIIVPSDVERSPKIMEQVFYGFHQYTTPNKFDKYCGWRPLQSKFSLEIASIDGKAHFFLYCPKEARNGIESHIYSHYPTAELFEVEDYTKKIPKVMPNRDWDVWGSTFTLVREDALPIRTYSYFKEDVTGQMIDPLASFLEVLGSIGKGEQIWYQVVITAIEAGEWMPQVEEFVNNLTKRVKKTEDNSFSGTVGRFFKELIVLPGNLFKGYFSQELAGVDDDNPTISLDKFNINELTPGEQERLKSISDNTSRMGFATTVRFVYLGKKNVFNKAVGVGGTMGALKQFSDVNLNSLKPDNLTKTYANYYFGDVRLAYRQRKIVDNYRGRTFSGTNFVFHTDELATIFHFPDMSVKAASISRIEAQKSDAPANLPVEDGVEFEPSR